MKLVVAFYSKKRRRETLAVTLCSSSPKWPSQIPPAKTRAVTPCQTLQFAPFLFPARPPTEQWAGEGLCGGTPWGGAGAGGHGGGPGRGFGRLGLSKEAAGLGRQLVDICQQLNSLQ